MDTANEPAADFAPPTNMWKVVSAGLAAAAAIAVLAGVIYTLGLRDVDARDRIEVLSSFSANLANSMLVLGAALTLIAAARCALEPGRYRLLFALTFGVAIIVVLLSIYSVLDIATMKVEQAPFSVGISVLTDGSWQNRLAAILPHVAAGVVAGLAMVLANRHAPVSGSHASATTRQG